MPPFGCLMPAFDRCWKATPTLARFRLSPVPTCVPNWNEATGTTAKTSRATTRCINRDCSTLVLGWNPGASAGARGGQVLERGRGQRVRRGDVDHREKERHRRIGL